MLRLLNNNIKFYNIENNYFMIKLNNNNLDFRLKNRMSNIKNSSYIKDNLIIINWKDYIVNISKNKLNFGKLFSEDEHPEIIDIENININEKYFIKPIEGSKGDNIKVLEGKELKNIDKKEYIIQKFIDPKLYNGYKYDIRIYYIICRKNNVLKSYRSLDGKIRFCNKKYNENGFVTNSSLLNDEDKLNIDKLQDNIMNFYDKKSREKIYDLLDILDIKIKNEILKKDNENGKLDFINIYGVDILEDKNNHFYLLEINGKPNWYHTMDSQKLTNIKKNIFNEISQILLQNYCNRNIDLKYWEEI